MATNNLTVEFSNGEGVSSGEDEANSELSLVLDEDKNNNQTSFALGSDAFVRVFPANLGRTMIQLVNIGYVYRDALNIPLSIVDEEIYFDYTTYAYLEYKPYGGVSYRWIGTNGGHPVFSGKKVTIATDKVAVLKCSYKTLYDRLRVTYKGSEETNVLLVGIRGDAKSSLIIPFIEGAAGALKDVTINIKDYCNGNDVAYAIVTISGEGVPSQSQTTDVTGQTIFENLIVGKTYNIKVTAAGYHDSDLDSLDNASFTVT